MITKPQDREFYAGLTALEEMLFPKKCGTCGREFHNLNEFVEATAQIGKSSGLAPLPKSRGSDAVGVFRNCVCGSTLLVPCTSRRSSSPDDVKRRGIFGKLMEDLERRGWTRSAARKQLLMFMSGHRVEFTEPPHHHPELPKQKPKAK